MPENDLQAKIERLQATITAQEKEITALEKEIYDLRHELEPFEKRYQQATARIQARIEAAQAAIRDLEDLKEKQFWEESQTTVEDLWKRQAGDQSPKRDSPPEPEFLVTPPKRTVADPLKQLYRRLARQYHPDLARDDAERNHRNQIMAMINDAYRDQDIEALRALDDTTPEDAATLPDPHLPLAVLKLRQLEQTSADLAIQIQDLKAERFDLSHCEMMDLKLREKLAKLGGRDLMAEIVEDLQKEYQALMRYLDKLRLSIRTD